MAKGKHAAALFEVIQSSRLKQSRPKPVLPSRWWFTRKKPAFTLSSFSTTSVAPTQTPPPVTIAPVAEPAPVVEPTPAPPRRMMPRMNIKAGMKLDQAHKQIAFKLSYQTAIVGGFAMLVAFGLVYAIGKHMHRTLAAQTSSPSTAELRSGPAHPDVLDVSNPGKGELVHNSNDNAQTANLKQPKKQLDDLPKPPPSSNDVDRVVGKQYVVIQSYTDEKAANDIAALLQKNNVPCSVIKALPNWGRADTFSIVGTTGFDRIRSNPDFDHYEANIVHVGEQLAANGHFRKFEPHPYRWKGTAS